MIFDAFCGIAERHYPEVIPLLRNAHLFEFPGDSHKVLPKTLDADQAELLSETFFLPFPIVAMEDPVSCVVLFDKEVNQQGIGGERFFAECLPLDYKHLSRTSDATEMKLAEFASSPQGAVQISFGRVVDFKMRGSGEGPPIHISGQVDRILVADKRKIYATEKQLLQRVADPSKITDAVLRNVLTAFEEVLYCNTPNRFVVERSDIASRPPPPHLKIPRSENRPRYVLLTPDEIRQYVGKETGERSDRKAPIPHHRRRHYRKLTAERYKDARGKTICVPASWVGPDSGVHGKTHYKVRLDL